MISSVATFSVLNTSSGIPLSFLYIHSRLPNLKIKVVTLKDHPIYAKYLNSNV